MNKIMLMVFFSALFSFCSFCFEGSPIETIDDEIILLVMQNLDAKSAVNFGMTKKKYDYLSRDENFWRVRLEQDFGPKKFPRDNPEDTWRNRYRAASLYAKSKASSLRSSSKKTFPEAHLYAPNGKLNSMELFEASIEDAYFYRANLSDSKFMQVQGSRSIYTYAQLERAKFANTALINANFVGAEISEAHFNCARLAFANFSYAVGKKPSFDGSELQHTNFSNANLTGANFDGVRLSHTNFSFASLRNASMKHINFGEDVDLNHTNLTGADLRESVLEVTNTYVTLEWLITKGAYFDEENPPLVGEIERKPGECSLQ